MNGLISYASDMNEPFDFGTTATYTCNPGSYLNGSDTRTCDGDGLTTVGTWTGTTPNCGGKLYCDISNSDAETS